MTFSDMQRHHGCTKQIVGYPVSLWHQLASVESDKMATKRPNNRQTRGSRETSKEQTSIKSRIT